MSELEPDMLSAYLDGELSPDERAAVEAQLAASADWRAELAEVRSTRDALRGLPLREARVGFWDAVREHVEAVEPVVDDTAPVGPVPIPAAPSRRRWAWVAAAAAAVAAV